ncbi:ABC transporter substrate-binding protein [Allorhizobium borbori]|uniref:Polar amino acid transport system substrate-binding protein n=1 Tax=Allorhizobium borbori TaxID=485907 RepID=A0A7W6K5H1_9HYPH|nr:ABC transporter substrate-binding protein [Allorhizobium borbori]MBB4105447.1 polar amino acid transport system substrate-binding protein [Allorhizobium borbori]PZU24596.1 MAG: amino acid ABC transporter substrate-binding protein [Shinella sp.]
MNFKNPLTCRIAGAVLAAGTLLSAPAFAAGTYGDCILTGTKGEATITPAVPGQFTVEINLPAVGDFNGDTPDTIKDGFEFCIAANIANRLGLEKLKLVNVAFDAIVAGQTKDYDLALAQVSITEPRKKVVSFSTPYASSDFGVATRADKPVSEATIKAGSVGVQSGTTMVQFAQEVLKPAKVEVFPDTSSMFTALIAGKIDAAMTNTSIILGQVANSGGKLTIPGQFVSGRETAGVYPKDSQNKPVIDKIIADLKADGTLKKLEEAYLLPQWGKSPSDIPFWKP